MTTEQAPGTHAGRALIGAERDPCVIYPDGLDWDDWAREQVAAIEAGAYQHGVHDGSIDGGYHDIEWETCTMSACVEARAK